MPQSRRRLPFALTAYGIPHVMGYLQTRGGETCADQLDSFGLMDVAVEMGLSGVEMPLPYPDIIPTEAFRDALESRDLQFVADFMVLLGCSADTFRDYLKRCAKVGAKVVRAMISTSLCGDRRGIEEGWEARLQGIAVRLKEVLPLAEDLGLAVAMENHQDATTDDLIR